MPVLVIEKGKDSSGLVLDDTAVIGRVAGLDLILKEAGVSRIHALVGYNIEDDSWFVEDMGSRNGTYVNHDQVQGRVELTPGDLIHVGKATLSFRMIETLPQGIEVIPPRAPAQRDIVFRCPECNAVLRAKPLRIGAAGRCLSCETKVIIPARSASVAKAARQRPKPRTRPAHPELKIGKTAKSQSSGDTSIVDSPKEQDTDFNGLTGDTDSQQTGFGHETGTHSMPLSEEVAAVTREDVTAEPQLQEETFAATATLDEDHGGNANLIEWLDDDAQVVDTQLPTSLGTCSVCQTQVLSTMKRKDCKSCNQTYHEECWYSMEGCSTYGCRSVGSLKEKPVTALKQTRSAAKPANLRRRRTHIRQQNDAIPWDWMFAAAAGFGLFVGPFTAGIPNASLLLLTLLYLVFHRKRRVSRIAVALSMVLCIAGAVGGYLGFMYLTELGWISLEGVTG
ncbi:MAG: FHA domain-containing protein [Phycisphaeraceae bacterium]|nr:FHA domain-containing protein [Phycisphaeraceae bacterium]